MPGSYYARSYGICSAMPNGSRPDFSKCAETVFPRGGWAMAVSRQCSRPCGHGPDAAFCVQHSKQFQVKQ